MKTIRITLLFVLVVLMTVGFSYADNTLENDQQNNPQNNLIFTPGEGYVQITDNLGVLSDSNKNIMLLMETPNSQKVWYTPVYDNNGLNTRIWFVYGKGVYNISVLEYLDDNVYSYIKTSKILNDLEIDQNLYPSSYINSDDSEIIALSKKITEGDTNHMSRARKIYDWVSSNIRYDLRKYSKMLKNDYSDTFGSLVALKSGKGVCFDYSTLFAALCRASDIQCRVITGEYTTSYNNIYHAWNQFYDTESARWVSLDTTMGYIYKKDYFDNLDFTKKYSTLGEIN